MRDRGAVQQQRLGLPARFVIVAAMIIIGGNGHVARAAPTPVTDVAVVDRPNDAGTGLIVKWRPSADDSPAGKPRGVREYQIYRQDMSPGSDNTAKDDIANQSLIERVPAGSDNYVDGKLSRGIAYRYAIVAVGMDGSTSAPVWTTAAAPVLQWFDRSRTSLAVIVAFICGSVLLCTELARRGWSTYVRPIAGLQAIEEAVGRSTEMGRPMLFVPGIMDIDQIETVAGLTVLAHVGQKAAEYDTPLEVPTARSLVMTSAREALQGSYLAAGVPESFDEDRVYYVTDDQFGYVAYTCGWMAREKPAACFFLGKFFAESLLLAEVGNSVGAIQLAGTAESAQLPFFVAACDYTLIGEELFAASAYLSNDPQQLGTLKGQDVGKLFAGAILIIGSLLATSAQIAPDFAPRFVWFRDVLLGAGGG